MEKQIKPKNKTGLIATLERFSEALDYNETDYFIAKINQLEQRVQQLEERLVEQKD